MSTSYPAEQIQTAVEKLVNASIRRQLDALGTRRVDLAYSDIQEAAASVLLLYPAAPFYCLALGAARLRDAVKNQASILDQVLEAVSATGRRVLPVADVSSLFGAKAALEELETAAIGRSKGFRDIAKVPSYQRFGVSVAGFLDGPGANVKSQGQLVETPERARKALPGLLRALQAGHLDLATRASQLEKGMADFAALNLPALVARGVISKARQVLGDHADRLEAMSEKERLLELGQVTLDVLTARAVVRQFGSFSGPTAVYPVVGFGKPYADSEHPAHPAVLTSTIEDITVGSDGGYDALVLTNDGATSRVVVFRRPTLATINGSTAPGWLIGDGSLPSPGPDSVVPDNNELRIQVDSTVYVVHVTRSTSIDALRTPENVVADINAVLPSNVRARAVFSPLEYSGALDIDADGTMHVPAGASDLVALGVKPGHLVQVLSGAHVGLYAISAVTPTSLTVPFYLATPSPGALVEIGPARRLEVACTDPAQALTEVKLTMLADTTKSANACSTLGFFPGISSTSRPTTVDELAEQVNGQTDLVVASTLFIEAVSGTATSSPTSSSTITFDIEAPAARWMTVRIEDGPNKGDYLVKGQGASAFEVLLDRPLALSRLGVSPLTFKASLGHKKLTLTGKTTGPGAYLDTSGLAASWLFGAPLRAYGTTSWVKLPSPVRGLLPGDWLELYDGAYNRATAVYGLVGVEGSLIEVSPALSLFLAPSPERWSFADDRPPPFARLRSGKSLDFGSFESRLNTWLARRENQASYFSLVNAKVNPLLVSESPTSVEVGDALGALRALGGFLSLAMSTTKEATLEFALTEYVVAPVPAVDTLVRTYKEKGSDRAIDLLLSGLFTTFFSLTLDEVSYAGAAQLAMRQVAQADLAVRRTNRADVQSPRVLSQVESPDYDYDSSDIEQGGQVDPLQ